MFSYEKLEAVWLKIKSVKNGRLLAYVGKDDFGDILTPNHLMCDQNIRTKSNAVVLKSIVQNFSKLYKYMPKLMNDQ